MGYFEKQKGEVKHEKKYEISGCVRTDTCFGSMSCD